MTAVYPDERVTTSDGESGMAEQNSSDRQREMDELLKAAERMPGVAEAIIAFGRLPKFTTQPPLTATIRYATSTNP